MIAHESHNHPSQVVPFEGAATGIGGIVRDVLCMGAEVIAVADPLRFGASTIRNRISATSRKRRSTASAPTATRSACRTSRATCTSTNASTTIAWSTSSRSGIVKESEIIHSYAPTGADGWDIVLVGKATDPSGFGGASFSSLTLDAARRRFEQGRRSSSRSVPENVLMRASYASSAYCASTA